ncbi:MAG: carbamoyl-phosphate synthase large subunit, partial [Gammaproteobacteria bacterium]
ACMAGFSLDQQGIGAERVPKFYAVKEAVFPFVKFPGVDPLLGPEMKSTGEVMGVGRTFGAAFARASLGAGEELPRSGKIFISVREQDRQAAIDVARALRALDFEIVATRGTGKAITDAGIECAIINKVREGRPHVVDSVKNGEISMIVNTTEGKQAIADSFTIRRNALQHKVPYATTMAFAKAVVVALQGEEATEVTCLQDLHKEFAS